MQVVICVCHTNCIIKFCARNGFWFDGHHRKSHPAGLGLNTSDTGRIWSKINGHQSAIAKHVKLPDFGLGSEESLRICQICTVCKIIKWGHCIDFYCFTVLCKSHRPLVFKKKVKPVISIFCGCVMSPRHLEETYLQSHLKNNVQVYLGQKLFKGAPHIIYTSNTIYFEWKQKHTVFMHVSLNASFPEEGCGFTAGTSDTLLKKTSVWFWLFLSRSGVLKPYPFKLLIYGFLNTHPKHTHRKRIYGSFIKFEKVEANYKGVHSGLFSLILHHKSILSRG